MGEHFGAGARSVPIGYRQGSTCGTNRWPPRRVQHHRDRSSFHVRNHNRTPEKTRTSEKVARSQCHGAGAPVFNRATSAAKSAPPDITRMTAVRCRCSFCHASGTPVGIRTRAMAFAATKVHAKKAAQPSMTMAPSIAGAKGDPVALSPSTNGEEMLTTATAHSTPMAPLPRKIRSLRTLSMMPLGPVDREAGAVLALCNTPGRPFSQTLMLHDQDKLASF